MTSTTIQTFMYVVLQIHFFPLRKVVNRLLNKYNDLIRQKLSKVWLKVDLTLVLLHSTYHCAFTCQDGRFDNFHSQNQIRSSQMGSFLHCDLLESLRQSVKKIFTVWKNEFCRLSRYYNLQNSLLHTVYIWNPCDLRTPNLPSKKSIFSALPFFRW